MEKKEPKYPIGTRVEITEAFRNGEAGYVEKVRFGEHGREDVYTVAFIGRQLATFNESGIKEAPYTGHFKKEAVTYLTEAAHKYIPVKFDRYKDSNHKKHIFITYSEDILVIDPDDEGTRYYLMDGKIITNVGNIASGRDVDIREYLCNTYLNGQMSLDWVKDMGIGVLDDNRNGSRQEIHWFYHPKVGTVMVKYIKKKNRSIPKEEWIDMEEVDMSQVNKGKVKTERVEPPFKQPKKVFFKERADNEQVSRENFFDLLKPTADTKVLLESGETVTSEPVLEVVRDLKQFIAKKDVNGYYEYMIKNPKPKALTVDDCNLLLNTVITEGKHGWTVFGLLISLDD